MVGSRLRRPRFATGYLALLLVVLTTLGAVTGFITLRQQPSHELRIVVEGEHDFNISQQSVDALLGEPIRSWKPLTMTVTDRLLTGDQLLRGEQTGSDILLSTRLEDAASESMVAERFTGAGLDRNLVGSQEQYTDLRFEISRAFEDNLGLGHGPAAVVAVGQRAAEVLYSGPVRSPIFWVALLGAGAMLTGAALSVALAQRRRWNTRNRRLGAAQRKLARVVLDLEALDATYQATDAQRRPAGFTKAWRELHRLSTEAAREEQGLVEAVFSVKRALGAKTGQRLTRFEADCRRLTELADGLLGAGSVHASLAGTGSTFDRLSQPLNAAANQLLIRLESAPGRMVAAGQIEKLRGDLGALLTAANESDGSQAAIGRWSEAEQRLASTAAALARRLRRYPHGRLRPIQPQGGQLRQLRESLGLEANGKQQALQRLGEANELARAILGDVPSFDGQAPRRARAPRAVALWSRVRKAGVLLSGTAKRASGDEPQARSRWTRLGVVVAAVLAALIIAGIIVDPMTRRPEIIDGGDTSKLQLEIDGNRELLAESQLPRYIDADFTVPQHVTLALRDAEAYLQFQPDRERELVPRNIPDTLWRIKSEFPDELDPHTGELASGRAILPVMFFDDGEVGLLGIATGEVALGDYSWGQLNRWIYGNIDKSKYAEITVANALQDYAEGLQRNEQARQDAPLALLYWLLVILILLTAYNAIAVVRYLASATRTLGRWGRGGRALRAAHRQLERLALGLDDAQLNAVAVLGAAPAGKADEAGPRRYQRGAAMALGGGGRTGEDTS